MSNSSWPCDPYRIGCTYLSKRTRLIPPVAQILTKYISLGFQVVIESNPPVLQNHACVIAPGLKIITERSAHIFPNQLD